MDLKYKRVLLKLSGEALKGENEIYDKEKLDEIVDQLITLANNNLQLGIVIGGGNIWRGKLASDLGIPQLNGDYMGMMATLMNVLALQARLNEKGYNKVIVYSALDVRTISSAYNFIEARQKLEEGYIVLFATGTGYGYFTTDTTATIRGIEIDADAILMAKNGVKGVYDSDPKVNPNAKFFEKLTYNDIVEKDLQVMDQTAAILAKNGNMKIEVFDMSGKDNLVKMAEGKLPSTTISK
ncbi:UMP kinase [Mesoplasma lactucae]|uniref:Uridylate kinase n=1 Tax=Mesoplasma lactucae ATCC 49193 TaxID=81460 RepID=A0A291IRA3_9MOLU|nr:UMP kinase [Mesoplasma lactucae]ATG97268.1 UMP kinase [Mesoplasma lactucae ATCC 49193]ATZ20283.1 uridylate kinase [Mesoplasma lactucae ATCC 49193]MCL8216454.1 Uridylate kinase [Mesoplasma lactucae ATCC 49193]